MATQVNPFTFVNSITYDKKDIYNEETKKHYVPFMINRALSYYVDTVLYANEMNLHADLPKYMQYSYYLNSIAKRKRFSKWGKKAESEDLDLVMELYQLSHSKAIEFLSVLTPAQVKALRQLKTGSDHERKRN